MKYIQKRNTKGGSILTKLIVNPGVCNLITKVEASSDDQMEVTLKISSGCESVNHMIKELGNTFEAFDICLTKPGQGPFYEYASEHFPGHAACPVIAGIIKCAEVECRLALPKDATIHFE